MTDKKTFKYDFRYRPDDPEAYVDFLESLEPTGYTSPRAEKPRDKNSRRRGVVAKVSKDHGFIRTDGQQRQIFFHRNDVIGGIMPYEGAVVSYSVGKDRQGRPAAVGVKVR